jgi:rubrerythrin
MKTGFTAEAAWAARYRALAARAEAAGASNLAAAWRQLAHGKDELAVLLLEASGQLRPAARAVADAIAEERFENDVLYPKMAADVDPESAALLARVIAAQRGHTELLLRLQRALQEGSGDVAPIAAEEPAPVGA